MQGTLLKFPLVISFLFFISVAFVSAQEKATVKGKIVDASGAPVEATSVGVIGTDMVTLTDKEGRFSLEINAGQPVIVTVSHIGFKKEEVPINLSSGEIKILDFNLQPTITDIPFVLIEDEGIRYKTLQRIDPKVVHVLPSASGGVEGIIKTLPGVASNNELSSQYSVRGGNYDENLVYVNDIEIYRPLLIRAGQQEGLSFINSDMVSSILFSAGGFDAKYGDKMSSVLDIKYRKARSFSSTVMLSALGGSVHLEGASKDLRLTSQFGVRHKSNQYLLNSLQTKGDYKPSFTDLQSFFTYDLTEKWELNFLGNISRNQYRVVPQTRETEFGTVNQALKLTVYFDGQEEDQFNTYMSAFSAIHRPTNNLTLKFITSAFQSHESESFDIQGQYWLDELEKDLAKKEFGEVAFNRGIGTFINHARNKLDATVINAEHKGYYFKRNNSLQWGVKQQHEIINDKLSEWKVIDSSDYVIPQGPPDVILLQEVIKTKVTLESNRLIGYVQNTYDFGDSTKYSLTGGVRANYWDLNHQLLISPRASLAVKPNWSRNVVFRASGGVYYQPPFYRELRDFNGEIHTDVKAQQAIHLVLGSDLNFTAWNRPFKFVSELYYKDLNSLIPYEYENVRIRYYAKNNSKGFANGVDFKVNGEFVSGVESWASLSVMQIKEDIIDDREVIYYNAGGNRIFPGFTTDTQIADSTEIFHGYIPRPTDQRVNFSLFFQDYIPKLPDFKMNLGLYFGSGLPFGPPDNTRYKDTLRMPPYRRVDIGFSYIVFDERKRPKETSAFRHFKSLWISAEIFNLLQVNNTLSYLWIKDITNRTYAIPNYLTSRILNIKIVSRF